MTELETPPRWSTVDPMSIFDVLLSASRAAEEDDATHVLPDSSARMVVIDAEHAPLVGQLRRTCSSVVEVIVVTEDEAAWRGGSAGKPIPLSECAATARTEDPVDVSYASGWLRTGNLAKLDAQGFLYFMGQTANIVRRTGENLADSEVEQVLRSHPTVLEAAVISYPEKSRGEEAHALVVLDDGCSLQATPPETLIEFRAQRLSKHKVPRFASYRAEDLPRTPSLRVHKPNLLTRQPDWERETVTPPTPAIHPTEEPA